MAMAVGGSGRRVQPSMNVTPLVDVVLGLLIIFMVVTPLMVRRLWLNVPKRVEAAQADAVPPAPPLLLLVRADGRAELDKQATDDAQLARALRETFGKTPERALFFRAAPEVLYGRAMDVLDIAKGAGARAIAVVPDEVVSR